VTNLIGISKEHYNWAAKFWKSWKTYSKCNFLVSTTYVCMVFELLLIDIVLLAI